MHCIIKEKFKQFSDCHEFERLSADILNIIGYNNVEPIAPMGGPDGGRDIKYSGTNGNGVAFVTIRKDAVKKFKENLSKLDPETKEVSFFCNVDITPDNNDKIQELAYASRIAVHIFDLERLRSLMQTKAAALRERYLGPIIECGENTVQSTSLTDPLKSFLAFYTKPNRISHQHNIGLFVSSTNTIIHDRYCVVLFIEEMATFSSGCLSLIDNDAFIEKSDKRFFGSVYKRIVSPHNYHAICNGYDINILGEEDTIILNLKSVWTEALIVSEILLPNSKSPITNSIRISRNGGSLAYHYH